MDAPLKDCTTLEQRAVIRFLNAEGIQTSQICQRMKNIYEELKGKRFDSDEDVQKVVQDFFHTLPKSAYKEGIYKLPERWRRCIESQDLLSQSPYSPDLATSDIHLSLHLKKFVSGKRFASNEEVEITVNEYSNRLPNSHFRERLLILEKHWTNYVEIKNLIMEFKFESFPKGEVFMLKANQYGVGNAELKPRSHSIEHKTGKLFQVDIFEALPLKENVSTEMGGSTLVRMEGREDANDEQRAGRPSTSTTGEKINEVEKIILANRRITVREVVEDLNISIGSCHSIFINDLGMRRVAAKFVPKLLNCDQKQHRMNIANEMLDSVRDDPNLLQRVITGDEAWVYGYDVETKAQSSQWKLPHEPRPKKARQVRSNVKVLLTVFFDCRGVVHHEFLPQGRTINKEYYLQVMRNLREAIRQKHSDLWKNKNWLLHHDNAPAHTSLLVRDFLAKNNTLMMPQPPYSPDLAPCDFFLFPKLKRPMKGRRYATLDEIKTASKEELQKILKNDFLKCFEDWKNCWHKCIISHGDYFEGDKIGIHE
ncbi:hypothetical protein LAZ67_2004876 [Cordylochernes scorpioides]|uniref:Transposase n=1 Tax=Cordylochernes scorpioides TaxID=51811 RepID=A0ABY6K4S2_9ARAC|nr:hypothetical protein LAZ67_2004876 [Cordylochernes scorpioides]